MTKRFALSSVAFVSLLAAACPPLPPEGAPLVPEEVSTPPDPVIEEPPSRCPLPIAEDAREWQTNYELPPSETARLRVWTTGLFDDGTLVARYEQRDEDGFSAGSTTYRCDPGGLWLVSTMNADAALTFEPPLAVWPVQLGRGDASGTVVRTGAAGDALALRYEYAWDAAGGGPPLPFAGRGEHWLDLRYALVLAGADETWAWQGQSMWGVVDGSLVLAWREVEQDGRPVRVEDARFLRAP